MKKLDKFNCAIAMNGGKHQKCNLKTDSTLDMRARSPKAKKRSSEAQDIKKFLLGFLLFFALSFLGICYQHFYAEQLHNRNAGIVR